MQEPSLVDAYENTVDDTELAPFTAVPIGTPYKSLELGVFFDTFDNGVNRAAFNNSESELYLGFEVRITVSQSPGMLLSCQVSSRS